MEKEFNFYIEEDDEGKRLDRYLSEVLPDYSRTKLQGIIKNAQVLINEKHEKPSYTIRTEDVIKLKIEETGTFLIKTEDIPLDIKYEDETMLVVNKPKSMLTHPTTRERTNTLVNALLFKYGYEGLSDLNGIMRPGIVHRLDRNTSGLLMIAKTNEAHEFLTAQIKAKTAKRKYLAVVQGIFEEKTGTVDKQIDRNKSKPEKMDIVEGGKPSVTHYRVLEEFRHFSYIELELETGRTHQIRIHMTSIGHPIVNDSLYNSPKLKVKTQEQVLQAYDLTFKTQKDSSIINVKIEEDEDIKKTLKYLRSRK